jgi:hypothetical protein
MLNAVVSATRYSPIPPPHKQIAAIETIAAPGTYRYPWQNLLDLRVSRSFSLFREHVQFEPFADLFNVFNSSAITSQSTTINSTNSNKLTPSAIDYGMVARFGGKIMLR